MFVLVSLAGMAGFIVSYGFLAAGYTSMPVRYGISATTAYLAFLTLLGLYVSWKRHLQSELDAVDLVDAASHSVGRPSTSPFPARDGDTGTESTSWIDADADLGWVLLIVVAAIAGVIAVSSIVWTAPVLLAEVLVDALIVSTVSHQLSQTERRDWTATAIRRTWIPALVVIVTMVVSGWALQRIAPEAVSIGPALQAILG